MIFYKGHDDMRTQPPILTLILLLGFAPSRATAQIPESKTAATPVKELIRYEPTGLSLLGQYQRGQIPVVFVHGLWSNPWSWNTMIEALESDPALKDHFQFWTFGYSTGDPIPYSAYLFRTDLHEVRQKLDPAKSDDAFDRMVLIGHSMGGLVSRMAAADPGERLWRIISDRPVSELRGEDDDRKLLRDCILFPAQGRVRRVVYIATPHRGSRVDRGSIQRVGTRLIRLPDPLRAAHRRLIADNPPDFFHEHFRKSLPTSIDELEFGSPILSGLSQLPHRAALKVHSIIAVRPESPKDRPTDGLVTLESAHLDGVASEKIVSSGHLCQDNADVIAEVRRILAEHLAAR
jgi:pimeloyl-ACP methyl ester carboxylesterase